MTTVPSPRQYPLLLPHRAAMGKDDFLVTTVNEAAVAWVDRWPAWPQRTLIIYGEPGCGKSHLLHVWQTRANATLVTTDKLARAVEAIAADPNCVPCLALDEADVVAGRPDKEQALFHLYNLAQERGGSLMLASPAPPAQWDITLPDLASRLRACPQIAIAQPDDDLLAGLLLKQFSDRQVRVGQDVLDYLLARMPRRSDLITDIVERLDAASLAEGRAITIPLARRVLESMARAD